MNLKRAFLSCSILLAVLVGCGEGGDTTVIKKEAAPPPEATTPAPETTEWPAYIQRVFLKNCEKGFGVGGEDYCGCALDYLEARFKPWEAIRAMKDKATLNEVVNYCVDHFSSEGTGA